MITRIVVYLLPFSLVPFGMLMCLGGVTSMFDEAPPSQPVEMSTTELSEMPVGELPPWISLKDAQLDWANSKTVTTNHRVTDALEDFESQIIPLKLDAEATTAYVVHFAWDEFKTRFAEIADSIEADREIDTNVLQSTHLGTVTFKPRDANNKYVFGVEREVVAELVRRGFPNVQVIIPDSRPPTRADAAAMAMVGMSCFAAGAFWIRRRKRKKVLLTQTLSGIQSGIEKPIRLGVAEGVHAAFEKTRERASAS